MISASCGDFSKLIAAKPLFMACPEGIEPPTHSLEVFS